MKGDFSRNTYDRAKHFSRVLQQQGRPRIDADWNEQAEIMLHYVRTLAVDLMGRSAGPAGGDLGFEISATADSIQIGPGRYYVDGILCENESVVYYREQDDFPGAPAIDCGESRVVYLDVWERHVTALEDNRIREVALGGPTTATRTKVVWQVKLDDGKTLPFPITMLNPENIRKEWAAWIRRWQSPHTGRLRAQAEHQEQAGDPNVFSSVPGYRGLENFLYRVEIHQGGPAGEATFKWSRRNGSTVWRATLYGVELCVEVDGMGWLNIGTGSWVELTNDGQELRGCPGKLVKVIDSHGDRLTLESAVEVPSDVPVGESWPTKVRLWDHHMASEQTLQGGALPVIESAMDSGWMDLENGIQIQFLPAGADGTVSHCYRTGDYWIFPARTDSADIEWTTEADGKTPEACPPHGILHHYAPLAIIHPGASHWAVKDCRSEIQFPVGAKKEIEDIVVQINHPNGDIRQQLQDWIETGPGPIRKLRPIRAYDRNGQEIGMQRIPFRYRNSFLSRCMIRIGLIKNPWR